MKKVYWKVCFEEKCKLEKERQHIQTFIVIKAYRPLLSQLFSHFLSLFWTCPSWEGQHLTVSHTLFSCQRKLSISASLPLSGCSSGSLILLSGVIYERCVADLLHAYSTCWCWRIRAKAAAIERGEGRKRGGKEERTHRPQERAKECDALWEKENLEGPRSKMEPSIWWRGISVWLCELTGMQLTDHTTNDGCYDGDSRIKQTSDEQALINSVVQLQMWSIKGHASLTYKQKRRRQCNKRGEGPVSMSKKTDVHWPGYEDPRVSAPFPPLPTTHT